MNVTWTDEALRRFDAVDVAIAVATDRGLMTPVVRDVGSLVRHGSWRRRSASLAEPCS